VKPVKVLCPSKKVKRTLLRFACERKQGNKKLFIHRSDGINVLKKSLLETIEGKDDSSLIVRVSSNIFKQWSFSISKSARRLCKQLDESDDHDRMSEKTAPLSMNCDITILPSSELKNVVSCFSLSQIWQPVQSDFSTKRSY
jgi:hypothetical protein